MNATAIKDVIKSIEIHHKNDWWIAVIPEINVATQAKTLSELGVEVERIIIAHFETAIELGTVPFRHKHPSAIDEATKRLNAVLAARTSTYAAISSALRAIEQGLLSLAAVPHEVDRQVRAEMIAAASAIAAVAAIVEIPPPEAS